MKKQYTFLLVMLLGLLGFNSYAQGPTFVLQEETAKVYVTDSWQKAGDFVCDLVAGQSRTMESTDKQYAIVAPEGKTMTITSSGTDEPWITNPSDGQYNAYYCLINGWSSNTYTIKMKDAPVFADSYDVTFNITGGGTVDIMKWKSDYSAKELVKSVSNGDVANLPANVIYDCQAGEGYKLVSCTNAEGESQNIMTWSPPAYFQIYTNEQIPSSAYNVVLEADAPVVVPKTNIIVNSGAAELWKWGTSRVEFVQALQSGSNEVELADGTNYYIVAYSGYKLTSVTNAAGSSLSIYDPDGYFSQNYVAIPSNAAYRSASYTVTLKAVGGPIGDDLLIVNVDDATDVQMYDAAYHSYPLVNGRNEFAVEGLSDITFSSSGRSFYSITLNGEPMKESDFGYVIPGAVQPGTVVDIKTQYPDETYTITLSYPDEAGLWSKVTIGEDDNETDVEIVNNSFSVKAGTSVNLYADKYSDWTLVSLTLPDGTAVNTNRILNFAGFPNYSFYANKAGEIKTVAHKKRNIDVTLNLTGDPSNLKVAYGDPNAGYSATFTEVTDLKTGANTISIPEGYGFKVYPANGGKIESMTYKTSATAESKASNKDIFDDYWYAGEFTDNGGEINITVIAGEAPATDYIVKVYTNSPDDVVLKYYDGQKLVEIKANLVANEFTEVKVPIDPDYAFTQLNVYAASHESIINSVESKGESFADTDDWAPVPGNGKDGFSIFATEGTEIRINASHVTYENHAVVFTDNGNNNPVTLTSEAGRVITLGAGPNDVYFNNDDAKFTVANSRNTDLKIYVNDEKIEGNVITLTDNEIVKIYELSDALIKVSFSITATAAELESVKVADVKVDGNPVADATKPIEILPGSEVSFKVDAPEGVTVSVMNGEFAVNPVDGVYTVWPMTDAEIAISYTAQEAFALILKGTKIGSVTMTETDEADVWTATLPELTGSFTVTSNDGSIRLGSNGSKVELGVAYQATEGSSVSMSLDCESASDVTVTVNLKDKTVLVNGTSGIVTIARDQLDLNATYYDLNGRQIKAENIASGLYIRVAGNVATKIAVK